MEKLVRRLVVTFVLALVVYVGISLYADVGKLWAHLSVFPVLIILAACGLALANYALRFVKWDYYLRHLDIKVSRGRSLCVFLAGFVMSVTPGKVGEILKAYLLKGSDGVSMAQTAPVVVAERLTDLIAILALTVIGVTAFSSAQLVVAVGGAVVVLFLVVVSSRKLSLGLLGLVSKLPRLGRLSHKMEEFYDSMAALVTPVPLAWAVILSIAAWLCECVGFYLVVNAFPGAHLSLRLAVFIYALSTAAGALSFLPGGLGVTEGGMVALLVKTASGVGRSVAVAATLLIRLCTLWLAVLLGFVALGVLHRLTGVLSGDPSPPSEEGQV